jgi:exodeoxyribonuclease VII small subunit
MPQTEKDSTPVQDMSFEEAMAKLESLVRSMENGNTRLEDVIASFEEAKRLSAYCQRKLETLKRKIEILTKDGPEGQTWASFQPEADGGDAFIPPARNNAPPLDPETADDGDPDDVPF